MARAPDLSFERLVTERLVLEPIAPAVAAAVVRGDLSGLRVVVARAVLADNVPSRRALERAGFVLERAEGGRVWYALGGTNGGH